MPAHDYEAFWSALKREGLAAAYYFHGSENVLKDEALDAVLERALDPSTRDFNLDVRSAAQLPAEEIPTLCTTLPMMAERRAVVIRDVEAWARKARGRTAILDYLRAPAPETVLVLIQGAGPPDEESKPDPDLVKACFSVEFTPLRKDHALRWLSRRAGQEGIALEPEAAAHLLAAVDGGADLAASELRKLAGLAANGPITVAQVESLLGVRRGETPDDWVRAVLEGQGGRAAEMLPHVLAHPKASGVRLLTLLGQQLIGLAIARGLYDRGQRGGSLERGVLEALRRARVWGVDYKETAAAWSGLAPRWPVPRIRAALRAALDADRALKSTTISDDRGILTDLVLTLAFSGEAAA